MKRIKRLSVTTVGLVGLFTAAALAWFVLGTIEGTGVTHAGKGSATNVPVKVVIHEGVTPTQEEPIEELTIENTANPHMIEVTSMHLTITTGNEAECKASEFSIVPDGPESFNPTGFWTGVEYKPHYANVDAGQTVNLIGPGPSKWEANLKMSPTAPVGCENVEVKVHVVIN